MKWYHSWYWFLGLFLSLSATSTRFPLFSCFCKFTVQQNINNTWLNCILRMNLPKWSKQDAYFKQTNKHTHIIVKWCVMVLIPCKSNNLKQSSSANEITFSQNTMMEYYANGPMWWYILHFTLWPTSIKWILSESITQMHITARMRSTHWLKKD